MYKVGEKQLSISASTDILFMYSLDGALNEPCSSCDFWITFCSFTWHSNTFSLSSLHPPVQPVKSTAVQIPSRPLTGWHIQSFLLSRSLQIFLNAEVIVMQMLQEHGDIVLRCWTQCVFNIEEQPRWEAFFFTMCAVCVWVCTSLSPNLDGITHTLALIRWINEMDWHPSCSLRVLLPGVAVRADVLYHIDALLRVVKTFLSIICIPRRRSQLCLCLTLMFMTHGINWLVLEALT